MQWGQIKSLFILCFLVLNIFLIQQYLNSRDLNIEYLEESTLEENIKANIDGIDELPEETITASYLSASKKKFNEEERTTLNTFDNQTIELINDNLIISKFNEPIAFNEENPFEHLSTNVLNSDQYVYWGKNEMTNTLIFFQKSEDKPIYYNSGALLFIILNDDNEMTHYLQTMLAKEVDDEEQEDLITALEAVTYLYRSNSLMEGDEITEAQVGYHTIIPLSNVFAPAWKITINGQRNYFVNGIEGHAYSKTDSDFLNDTIQELLEIMKATSEKSLHLEAVEEKLTSILETTSWSGEK